MFCILRSFIRCVFVKLCGWCGFSGSTVTAEVKVLTTCQFHPPRRHKLPFFLFFVESAQSWTDLCTHVGASVLFRTLLDKSNTNFNHHDSKYVQPHVTNRSALFDSTLSSREIMPEFDLRWVLTPVKLSFMRLFPHSWMIASVFWQLLSRN